MIAPLLGVVLVLAALGGLMLVVGQAQRHTWLRPELARKSVHIGMGLVCLSFPWLFREAWQVWLLAGLAVLPLIAVRRIPALAARFGSVLGGVSRQSWGELLFPIAVAFVFSLAHEKPLLYCIPVLILSFADAAAALVGQRYGVGTYATDDGRKSLEGSVAFFFGAFFSTHLPLLLASTTGRLESVLIAVVMGLILMLLEAISWRGLDNLLVPLVSYVCLVRMIGLTPVELWIRIGVLSALLTGLWIWHRSTRLTQAATVGAALILYVACVFGDWHWLIAPVALAATYTVLCRGTATAPQTHNIHAIAAIGGLGLVWLCVAQVRGTLQTIYPYGVGYAAHLGIIALAYYADPSRQNGIAVAILKATALGFVVMATPYVFVWWKNPHALPLALGALLFLGAGVGAFAFWQPQIRACPANSERWARQTVVAGATSALAFALLTRFQPWSRSFL